MTTSALTVKVDRILKLNGSSSLKAFADITVNDALLIRNVRVIEGKDGLFVSMPREQGKDSKWYDTVRCLSKEVREQLSNEVLTAYHAS